MKKIIIAAVADNGVIGSEGELSWHLPADLEFFYRQIEGAFLLTGRKSLESGQGSDIFDGRPYVVVTRREGYKAQGGFVANSIPEAIAIAEKQPQEKLCILGGAAIYKQCMELADELIITEVHTRPAGDAHFPEIDQQVWKEVKREDHQADTENPHDFSFVFYRRVESEFKNL